MVIIECVYLGFRITKGCTFYVLYSGFPAFMGGSEYLVFQDMLRNEPEYFSFLFGEDPDSRTQTLIGSMIKRDSTERPDMKSVLEHFKEIEDWEWDSESQCLKENGERIHRHPEDSFILELLEQFKEFDKYEDIEVNYQIKEFRKKLEAEECGFDEETRKRLDQRLGLLHKQLLHRFGHKDFQYTRGPVVIDEVK